MIRAALHSVGIALLAVVGFTPGIQGQGPLARVSPAEVGLAAETLDRIGDLVRGTIEDGEIAGAVVGVARRGGIAYLESFGLQDLASGTPMSEESLFRIYSMSRAVTAVGVMTLVEEGRLSLHDPVSMHLPVFERARVLDEDTGELRPPSRPVTVRDLLVYTSGISSRSSALYRERNVRSRAISMEQFVQNVADAPLMEDPGTAYRYGVATTVAAAVAEAVSGQPFDAFLEERVLVPLGMDETVFWVDPEREARFATVYRQGDDGLEPYQIEEVPFTEQPGLAEGGVGLVSTVPDFLRFSQMLLDGGVLGDARVLSSETVAEITTNGLPPEVLAQRRGGTGWGIANVSVVMDPDSPRVGEYGWDGSAGTVFWINPAEDLVIVAMWQSSPANPDGLRQSIQDLVYEAIVD